MGLTPPLRLIAPAPHRRRQILSIGVAVGFTIPGIALRASGGHPAEWVQALVFGFAIVGAAFLLAWAAEAFQLDVSQGLALALLALIAVLPEYAVDFVFTWKAGEDPDEFAPLALANMTGANRLLIGIGWSMVVLLAAWRIKRVAAQQGYHGELDTTVHLDRPHAIEIAFLAAATVYSLTLPLKRTITLVDAGVLVGIFLVYAVRISRAPAEEPHLVGPAQLIGSLPTPRRRLAVAALFAFSAATILLCAEPFAEALVESGEQLGIDTFLLVQWVAPLASEAPELLVAGLFAWRLNTNAALGALVSSKVNQWTLLVGSLPIVFAISSGTAQGLPVDAVQREELFLTAAQSVFAVAVLMNRSLNVREAFTLMGLFLGQFMLGAVLPEDIRAVERIGVGILYLVLSVGLLYNQRRNIRPLAHDGFRASVSELVGEEEPAHA
jgi:cation:H+ antiporter